MKTDQIGPNNSFVKSLNGRFPVHACFDESLCSETVHTFTIYDKNLIILVSAINNESGIYRAMNGMHFCKQIYNGRVHKLPVVCEYEDCGELIALWSEELKCSAVQGHVYYATKFYDELNQWASNAGSFCSNDYRIRRKHIDELAGIYLDFCRCYCGTEIPAVFFGLLQGLLYKHTNRLFIFVYTRFGSILQALHSRDTAEIAKYLYDSACIPEDAVGDIIQHIDYNDFYWQKGSITNNVSVFYDSKVLRELSAVYAFVNYNR
ncbi:MAG: hypothetical protein NC548_28495 [Lachnospiraceae bacterium]|nr:hypothetical protein [Lachnospiraceae bacterium]MCM1234118.1 hypothetical protein [Ruminococcus flavefaciens]